MYRRLGRLLFGGLVAWLSYALLSQPVAAQNGTLAPVVRHQFFTSAGAVCGGCLLNAYAAGTTTRLDTFSDVTLTTPNANPIVLDAAGRATIYLSNNSYRFILTDADAVQIWDADNVSAIPASSANLDVTATAGEALTANAAVYLSSGEGALTAGRWYLADADNTYESSTATQIGIATAAIASGATGTIRLSGRVTGLSALTAGEDYYISATDGALTTTPPVNGRLVGRADTTTTLIVGGQASSAVSIPDSDGTHRLVWLTTSNLTADRTVSLLTGDANRALTLSGNLTVSGNATVDQNLSTTGNPTFGALTVTSCAGCTTPPLNVVEGRCTLTSGTAVTTTDVTAATTIYFTPHKGNRIALHDGSATWNMRSFSQLSLAVPATTNTMYDLFVDDTGGTPALEAVAWTNDTTRATALTTQDGVYVQTSDTDSRYVCSFRTTGVAGQTEDSRVNRYVWNYYNRVPRLLERLESTASWAYTTATIRQANGAAANQVAIVVGVAEDPFYLSLMVTSENNTADIARRAGIGEGSTTSFMSASVIAGQAINALAASNRVMHPFAISKVPAIGRQFYSWNEWSTATGTTTWTAVDTAVQAGLQGWILG